LLLTFSFGITRSLNELDSVVSVNCSATFTGNLNLLELGQCPRSEQDLLQPLRPLCHLREGRQRAQTCFPVL